MTVKNIPVDQAELRNSVTTLVEHVHEPDQSYEFLKKIGVTQVEIASIDINRLKRKIDWRILPILFLCYMMQFLDKVSLNYAAVMGMNQDINLRGNDFSNVATALFVAYLIAEIPNSIILNKVPVAKWMAANVTAWGVATACTAAARNYTTLLIARIFLGLLEASIAPCLTLICSQWYTKSEQASRFNLWGCGLGLGQIVGGLVSYGFQGIHNTEIAGWRIMFIVLGAVTVLLGISVLFLIPDTPMKARFLTNMEKAALLHHVSVNQTGVRNTKFKLSHLRELALDVQIWLLALITITSTISGGVITSYSTTLIRNFGFSPPKAALLNAPSGVVTIAANLISGYGVRYTSNRWAWLVVCLILSVVGACLMSFLPSDHRAGLLAGIYLVNTVIPVLFIIWQWTAANVAGHTKRVVAIALMSASFGVANLIGPQTFRANEAPGYRSAKITLVATLGSSVFLTTLLFGYYVRENRRRDAKAQANVKGDTIGQWENLTDKENSSFRYVY